MEFSLRFFVFLKDLYFSFKLQKNLMKKFLYIILIIFGVVFLNSCNSYPMDNTNKSDMNRNTEELQKRQEAEKNKIEPNELNNFGKPNNE